ncbi:glycoside hydrolase [Streptacidiphilus pinicola]|uniref:Glycoside hydrolase n=1 Tax=Streptacidiphilus pinicola TaxID=2219663 RepID=A0A2X0IPV5_9ACTN|nr:glycoside hydrolase family 9 protein [Streptacidiphilus pinicola]RAG85221.1 glycoside hydrolase [Streptacidiphilus pinicola]
MPLPHRRRTTTGLAALVVSAAVATVPLGLGAPAAQAASTARLRVDQAGFLPGEVKQAYLMTGSAVSSVAFHIVDTAGATVLSGTVGGASRGGWNKAYPDVYPITFSGLTAPGSYRLVVSGGATATSPVFRVEAASSLYGKLVADGVSFFQNQRDGASVLPGPLKRQPSHPNDAHANVYAWPDFAAGGSDTITDSDLKKIGGPVDVSGGWFDAGDFLKFTHTAAFSDTLLLASQRALGPAAPDALAAEAHYGEQWLNKMWNQQTRTLYLQVGIGSGNAAGTFHGDHDLWRLPQQDDGDTTTADRYAATHRPAFEAAAPGKPISPNVVGRVSAAFALAAQVDAQRDPAQAAAEYQAATSLYAMADTSNPPATLTTALPNAYYPESTWHDDMELGGAEIALAAQALGRSASPYLAQAATWAKDYLAGDTGDTFNLYDTSALAHADLLKALAAAGDPAGLAVTPAALTADLKRQVRAGATKAGGDIFHAGGDYTNFDVDAHTFGFLTIEALYRQATGDRSYEAFATEQRDWLLGANAWGTSFMVGEGSTFPDCMQHQVANLSGSTDGKGALDVGGVVNGPNNPSNFTGGLGGYQTGMVACPPGGADPFNAFTGHDSRFSDDVRSWQTDEPALDMTGSAVLGAALQQSVH